MPEETVVAESSSAPVEAPAMDISRGPLVDITPEQRAEFRKTGELPKPPKTEEAAPSPEAKEAENVTASEAEKQQEKPKERKQTAEERIAQLEATIEKIRKGANLKETPKVESSPAKAEQPQNYQEWRKAFKPAEWVEKYSKDNPEASYEEATAAMADHLSDVREEFRSKELTRSEQERSIQGKISEAQKRYENFNDKVAPFVDSLVADPKISPLVKQMVNDSEIFADLAFTLAGDEKFMEIAKDPAKAIRYIALTESLIVDELAPKTEEKTPAKPQTQAPKPPSEVGGRATSPGDELASAAKSGDFRAFKQEANRRALAKLKG